MGYFSQRKKHARQKIFMLISLMALSAIYILLCFDNGTDSHFKFLRQAQFHFYLYNIFLVIYTFCHRQALYTFLAIMLMLLNYGSLAKSARLFFNQTPAGYSQLNVLFQKGEQNYQPLEAMSNIKQQGRLELSPHLSAAFVSVEQPENLMTIVNLDFSTKYEQEYEVALRNLEKFVSLQNGPVIIVGDFGLPSWSPLFRTFLKNTDLSVKNRILFTDGKAPFRFWFVPTINILGFDNVGIKNISMQGQKFQIQLGY